MVGSATKTLSFLRRALYKCPQAIKEKAYMAIIRPKLEYCSSVWDPYQRKYIQKIEMVQRRAARFVKNIRRYDSSGNNPSITAALAELGWDTLQDRRRDNRLILLYKVKKNLIKIPESFLPSSMGDRPMTIVTRSHASQFQHVTSTVDAYKFSFITRTALDWNSLPEEEITEESTVDSLKMWLASQRH